MLMIPIWKRVRGLADAVPAMECVENSMTETKFDIAQAYFLARTIRCTEEKIAEIYSTDKVKSPVHLSIGQEAIAVGACMALDEGDTVFSNYRGHAHYLAKGGNLNDMWAELYGKSNGHAGGKAGSMHLVDISARFMPASAIVASAISNAVGYALALKMRKSDDIVLCFHGEGAADEGVFWESLNFAALKKVPVLFICENNGYAIYSKQKDRLVGENIVERARTFGIDAQKADGFSTSAVFDAVTTAAAKVRAGGGPMLIEVDTYRWRDHVGPDDDHPLGYRPQDHLDGAVENDDIDRLAEALGSEAAALIDARVEAELAAALNYAENGDFPGDDELMRHAYA